MSEPCPRCGEATGGVRIAAPDGTMREYKRRWCSSAGCDWSWVAPPEPPLAEGQLPAGEVIAWLVFRLSLTDTVSEGILSRALGVDRIRVREMEHEGRVIDERTKAERIARITRDMSPHMARFLAWKADPAAWVGTREEALSLATALWDGECAAQAIELKTWLLEGEGRGRE